MTASRSCRSSSPLRSSSSGRCTSLTSRRRPCFTAPISSRSETSAGPHALARTALAGFLGGLAVVTEYPAALGVVILGGLLLCLSRPSEAARCLRRWRSAVGGRPGAVRSRPVRLVRLDLDGQRGGRESRRAGLPRDLRRRMADLGRAVDDLDVAFAGPAVLLAGPGPRRRRPGPAVAAGARRLVSLPVRAPAGGGDGGLPDEPRRLGHERPLPHPHSPLHRRSRPRSGRCAGLPEHSPARVLGRVVRRAGPHLSSRAGVLPLRPRRVLAAAAGGGVSPPRMWGRS